MRMQLKVMARTKMAKNMKDAIDVCGSVKKRKIRLCGVLRTLRMCLAFGDREKE